MTAADGWLSLGELTVVTGWKAERIRSMARRGKILENEEMGAIGSIS